MNETRLPKIEDIPSSQKIERPIITTHLYTHTEDKHISRIFDKLDDDLIIEEIHKRAVETWAYHIPPKGDRKEIWGLSKKGVDQALETLERQGLVFNEIPVVFQVDPTDSDYMLFQATIEKFRYHLRGQSLAERAENEVKKISLGIITGYKRQWTKQLLKNGTIADDQYWFEKGCSKALRNAKMRAISIELETEIVTLAKEKGKFKDVTKKESKLYDYDDSELEEMKEKQIEQGHKFHGERLAESRMKHLIAFMNSINMKSKSDILRMIVNMFEPPRPYPVCLHAFIMDNDNWDTITDYMRKNTK